MGSLVSFFWSEPVEEFSPRASAISRQPSYYRYDNSRVSSTFGQATYRSLCQNNTNYYSGESLTYYPSLNRRTTDDNEILQRHFESVLYTNRNEATRRVIPWEKVRNNPAILDICDDDYFNFSQVVTFIPLSQTNDEYLSIKSMISKKHIFKIDSIEKIENPYLKKAYELKKAQKLNQKLYFVERLLFHGTKHENVDSICKFNFNWRLVKHYKFGKGISFSSNSTYASNYSDKHLYNKVMLVAKVLVGHTCPGHQFMELPAKGYDTSTKDGDDVVIVKYEDNEFCSVYRINYHLVDRNVRIGKGGRNNQRINYFN